MRHWASAFDKVYLINLDKRTDRLEQATRQLNQYGISFERWRAVEHNNGAEGLRLTMVNIFNDAITNNYENVLIFEDDIDIIQPDINEIMDKVVMQIPKGYDIIYLGCQLCTMPKGFVTPNLLNGIINAYATHAAIYSLKVMKVLVNSNFFAPIDNCIAANIQGNGNCYAVYPILCSQIISHSDIYTREPLQDWKPHLEVKYWKQINAMRARGIFNTTEKTYNG
jgi:GR25 family glycosyltransferase involved in LPS biosynthesis